MFQALKSYMTNTEDKVVAKEDVVTAAENLFSGIHNEILPAFKAVMKSDAYFNTDKRYILERLGTSLELHTDKPEKVVSELSSFFKTVSGEEKTFLKLVRDSMRDKIFPNMSTAQELAIMTTLNDLTSASLYVLDLMYFITIDEDTELPKKKIALLESKIPSFSSIVRSYNKNFGKHVDNLSKVSKTIVNTDAPVSMMDKLLAKQGKLVTLPIFNGFINNPIYHFRIWLADNQVHKYEVLKEKKKLLELKLLELKMKAEGNHDERLAKQIAYYEDKISGMEYEIRDIEDAV